VEIFPDHSYTNLKSKQQPVCATSDVTSPTAYGASVQTKGRLGGAFNARSQPVQVWRSVR
jgi:hypothetical protein